MPGKQWLLHSTGPDFLHGRGLSLLAPGLCSKAHSTFGVNQEYFPLSHWRDGIVGSPALHCHEHREDWCVSLGRIKPTGKGNTYLDKQPSSKVMRAQHALVSPFVFATQSKIQTFLLPIIEVSLIAPGLPQETVLV